MDSRAAKFAAELEQPSISLHELKSLADGGIPEKAGLRATVWKVRLLH